MAQDPFKNTKRQDLLGSSYEGVANSFIANVLVPWAPQREVFALRYGPVIMSTLGIITGVETLRRVRQVNGLLRSHHGFLATAFAGSVITVVTTYATQTFLVQYDIVSRSTKCPVCVQTRSASLLMLTSVALPTLMSIMGTYNQLIVLNFNTKYLKESQRNVKGLLQWSFKMLSKCRGIMGVSAVAQIALGALVVGRMQNEFVYVASELDKFGAILDEKMSKKL